MDPREEDRAPWPLDALPGIEPWRVAVMIGANPYVFRRLRRRAAPDVQLLVADTDRRRLRALWAGTLGGLPEPRAVFLNGRLGRLLREFPIVPSAVLIEAGILEEEQESLIAELGPRVAAGTGILVYGKGTGRALDRDAWTSAGFSIREAGRSRALVTPKAAAGEARGVDPAAFRLAAARRAKALFGSAASAAGAGTTFATSPAAGAGAAASRWPYAAQGQPLPPRMPDGSPWPRISIVTPSFNQGAFIEETILSVANQGYPNLEHIVIDGGSSDETRSVLTRHADVLAYWESEPDRGQSHAINKGMAHATGDILTWLNSDDRLAPGALAAVALAFRHSKADLVAGVAELYRDDRLVGRHVTACGDGPLPLDDLLDLPRCWYAGQFFYQPEVMFTRALWERAGGRVDEALTYSMDYELWVRFAEAGARLHVIGRPVAQFRMHASQKTHVAERFMTELQGFNRTLRERLGRTGEGPAPQARKLRVMFLNDVGFHYGAGTAHQRLAQALAGNGSAVTALSFMDGLQPGKPEPVDARRTVAVIERSSPDVVVLGNLHSATGSPELIDAISARWPTCIVMHDFWIVTGRCAYTGGCEKLIGGCDAGCPTWNQYPALPPNEVAPAWMAKRRILGGAHAPVLLANSTYTEAFARRALASTAKPAVEAIRLGIPTDVFVPHDKAAARRVLDIGEDAFVVMVAATAIDDPRKGGDLLAAALAQVRIPGLLVVAAGWYDPAKPSSIPGLRRMGYIDDPERMAVLYAAADLFVGASREETFGQVFVEAAACGTPVVAFRTSGVADAVADGVSGVLVPELSADALAAAIHRLYADRDARQRLSALGRIFVENEYSLAKSQQSFVAMLVRTGLMDRLRLPRNASMLPAVPTVECGRVLDRPTWTPGAGVGDVEGPYPEAGLPEFRWCEGLVSAFTIDVLEGGSHRVDLTYVNPFEGQRVVVACNKKRVGEFELPADKPARHRLALSLPLKAGRNTVELAFRLWEKPDDEDRALALMLVDVAIEAERTPAAAAA
jgi:hypothetical protein